MAITELISIGGTVLQLIIVLVGVYIVAKLAQNSLDTITTQVKEIDKKVEHLITNIVTEMKEDIGKLKGQVENICKWNNGDCNDE